MTGIWTWYLRLAMLAAPLKFSFERLGVWEAHWSRRRRQDSPSLAPLREASLSPTLYSPTKNPNARRLSPVPFVPYFQSLPRSFPLTTVVLSVSCASCGNTLFARLHSFAYLRDPLFGDHDIASTNIARPNRTGALLNTLIVISLFVSRLFQLLN